MLDVLANLVNISNLMVLGVSALTVDIRTVESPGIQFKTNAPATPVVMEIHKVVGETCKLTGIVTTYEQDYDIVTRHGDHESILPARPGVIAGKLVLINKKACPGKPVEDVLMYGTQNNGVIKHESQFLFQSVMTATDMISLRQEFQPGWIPQIFKKLEVAQANNDPVAAEFMDATKAQRAIVSEILTGKLPDAAVKAVHEKFSEAAAASPEQQGTAPTNQ